MKQKYIHTYIQRVRQTGMDTDGRTRQNNTQRDTQMQKQRHTFTCTVTHTERYMHALINTYITDMLHNTTITDMLTYLRQFTSTSICHFPGSSLSFYKRKSCNDNLFP